MLKNLVNRWYKSLDILNIVIFFFFFNLFLQDQLKQVKLEIANKIDFGNKWVFFDKQLLEIDICSLNGIAVNRTK